MSSLITTLNPTAETTNPARLIQSPTLIVAGSSAPYYGRYYGTALDRLLRRINTYLMRWAQQKYRRLRSFRKALRWWKDLTARQPRLFAHWAWENEIASSFG